MTPYMRFSKKIWDSVRSEHRDLHLWEVNKILGLMWRELPDTEKQEFQDEYDVEKAEYDKQVRQLNIQRKGLLESNFLIAVLHSHDKVSNILICDLIFLCYVHSWRCTRILRPIKLINNRSLGTDRWLTTQNPKVPSPENEGLTSNR